MSTIAQKIVALYVKFFSPGMLVKIWEKIVSLYSFPFEKFQNPWAICQISWQNHYDFVYKLWQKPFLKRAKDWWVVFWNFFSGLKNQVQAIPVTKPERKALFRSLSNAYFLKPFGLVFVLVALGVILDVYPFWRKMKTGFWRNFCAYYQFFFFRTLFFFGQQFLPSREIYVKMALAYIDIGDVKNARKIAEQMKDRFPKEKMAHDLIFEINRLGG